MKEDEYESYSLLVQKVTSWVVEKSVKGEACFANFWPCLQIDLLPARFVKSVFV